MDPEVPAPAHDLSDLLFASTVAIGLRQPTGQGEAPVAVHNDSHMGRDGTVLHLCGERTVIQSPQATLEPVDQRGLVWLEIDCGCPWAALRLLMTNTPQKVRPKLVDHV